MVCWNDCRRFVRPLMNVRGSIRWESPAILEVLSTETAIEDVIGKPSSKVLAKVLNSLDDICRAFIARSPFVVVASSDSAGNLDMSPKGDPAGFVCVLDAPHHRYP